MRFFLLFLLLFIPLSGCSEKQESNNLEPNQDQEKRELLDLKELESIQIDEKLIDLKKDLEKINLDESAAQELINKVGKSALELVDECIDSKKDKGLPIFECTKLLKQ